MHLNEDVLSNTKYKTFSQESEKNKSHYLNFIFSLFRYLKFFFRKSRKRSSYYSKVIDNSFDNDADNPWIKSHRINIEKNKLSLSSNRLFQDNFMSNSLASDWLLPITFICNICSLNKKTVNVMDFAGGTGISYFTMKPYLFELGKVNYKVIDINKSLLKLGKEHSIKTKSRSNITFDSVFPDHKMYKPDIIFVNTALQYLENPYETLNIFFKYKPKYIILTRLIAGSIKEYYTIQYVLGTKTRCKILNIEKFNAYIESNDYSLILKAENIGENLYYQCDSNIPEERRVRNTINLIYIRN